MRPSLHFLQFFLYIMLFSCGRTDNPDNALSTSDNVSAEAISDEPYLAWNDTIKAMGLRGDINDARNLLKIFQNACLDKTASRDFNTKGEEAKKCLYISWSNVISFLFNKGEFIEAIDEVVAMQKYAENTNDDYGIAMVEVSYGGLYTYCFQESIEHLQKALSYWEKSQNTPQMQYTYYMLSREMLGQAENCDSDTLANRLYAKILDNSDLIERLDTANTYMKQVSEYQRLLVHIATKDFKAARRSYVKVNDWWQNGEIAPQLRGMIANTMAQYLVTFDNPELATPLLQDINIPLFKLQTERLQSISTGNYRRAYELQLQIDKLNIQRINQLQQNQLAIANAAFNNIQLERDNHRLEMKHLEKGRMLIIISIVSIALLLVIFVLLMHQHSIRRKNMELVQRIKEQEATDKKNLNLTASNPENLSQTEQLFLRIEQLLQDEMVLTNPNLNRDMIASMLGTNRTYVVKAISECTKGKNVSGYINNLRVKLGRSKLEDHQKSIEVIAEECGFSSRSHFHNLFVAQYGITPVQFRKTLKRL